MKIKELRNNFDSEVSFTDLQKAKNHYLPNAEKPCEPDDYLGDDYEYECELWQKYKTEIESADTLEELAKVLTKYSDRFDNGSEYFVKIF